MAIYVELIKTDIIEPDFVYYNYQFSITGDQYRSTTGKIRYKSKVVSGKLKIDKRNGDVHTLDLAESDNGMYAERAGWALMKHWKKGEFPDKTCWAS